ncbi:methyltransferase [Devosia sp. ZB163]|uniref:class I SAM-dependent methyltransferase n=1 Tax=Devosia sp. ZB163 TaxID=3025938 RepID=UPI002361F35D|nr:methyltransferase [Devosia sp. ZB163]MDC9823753.1 methyltransferase [Devosia sp. ZB163]
MLDVTIGAVALRLQTEPGLFSPQRPDAGTLAMLSRITFDPHDKVLDLGCGYGLVGILAAHHASPAQVIMLDNDPRAVAVARRNAEANGVPAVTVALSDGFRDTRETGFTKIISNPPYHVDFSVPRHFIEKGFNRLVLGGTMWMVTKRRDWYRNKLGAIFGGCRVHEIDGYYVFEATRRRSTYARWR